MFSSLGLYDMTDASPSARLNIRLVFPSLLFFASHALHVKK